MDFTLEFRNQVWPRTWLKKFPGIRLILFITHCGKTAIIGKEVFQPPLLSSVCRRTWTVMTGPDRWHPGYRSVLWGSWFLQNIGVQYPGKENKHIISYWDLQGDTWRSYLEFPRHQGMHEPIMITWTNEVFCNPSLDVAFWTEFQHGC